MTGPGLTDDTASVESTTVTATRGASFMHGTAEGTAAVIVLPGAFAPSTKVTFTPLKGGGGNVLQPGFRIAAGGAQPKAPVFVAFAVPGELPDDAAVFAYEDGADEGTEVAAWTTADRGVTSLIAPASHLTEFRVERRGETPPPATSEEATPTGSIDFDSTAPYVHARIPGEAWDSEFTLPGCLIDPGGGGYVGPMKLAYYGDLDIEGATGMASAEWTGPMQFSELRVVWHPDWWLPAPPSEEDTSGIVEYPRSPFTLTTTGRYVATETQAFLAWLEVEGLGRRRVPVDVKKSISPGGTVGCSLWINAGGVFAVVGDRESAGDYMPAGPFLGKMNLPEW